MRRGSKQLFICLICTICVCILFTLIFMNAKVFAQSGYQEDPNASELSSVQTSVQPIVGNDVCLGCHGKPGSSMTLQNGEILDLYVDPDNYAASIHGKDGYACVQCHTDLGAYPHPLFTETSLRDTSLRLTQTCNRCHSGEYMLTMDSIHYDKLAIGIKEAAVCTDCHGSHNVQQWTDSETNTLLPEVRLNIPVTCSRCHSAIYQKYLTSVHGAALTEEGNTDVPTCIDCHGVHNIGNPTTSEFRLNSPQICADCHTDPALMDKYGISTDVLNTYVSDFHGTTVTLFQKQSPDAETNKPVCYDCHGVHDISKVDDPKTGIEMQENLLVRCQECHPDATSNFPSSWMSHYIPSPEHYPLVYYVNLFYKVFIPLVLGGMIALVGLDVGHSFYVKAHREKHSTQGHPPEAGLPTPTEVSTPVLPSEANTASPAETPPLPPQPEANIEEEQHD
jgi:nitrate/TMAO reductase-like tetraheme cytochrome c subunit